MTRIIYRDYSRTESDDYKLRVEPVLNRWNEAVCQYGKRKDKTQSEMVMFGWLIQSRGE